MKLEIYQKNELEENYIDQMNESISKMKPIKLDDNEEKHPLIYIVGAPRSGTTILSQVLSSCLDVGYINNLIARFWENPAVGILLSKRLLNDNGRDTISFLSRHGTTSQIGDPHEFGNYWTKILNLNQCKTHSLSESQLDSLDKKFIKDSLEDKLIKPFGSPVLFKNIICGFHAKFLSSIYPNSLFIFIERNNIDTMASILKVRKARLGDEKQWWSLKPKGFPQQILSKSPIEEITKQVVYSKQQFIKELDGLEVNSYYLRYEDFCKNPNKIIEEIANRISKINNKPLKYSPLKQSLNIKSAKIERNIKEEIITNLNKIKGSEKYEYNSNNI